MSGTGQANKATQRPLEMLMHWEAHRPAAVFMRQPLAPDRIVNFTWAEVADQVRRMATVLVDLQLPAGSSVAIISKNCAHWIMADWAIWMAGHVSVPMFPNAVPEMMTAILKHADVRAVFAGKLDNVGKVLGVVPKDLPVIGFPYHDFPSHVRRWDECLSRSAPMQGKIGGSLDDLATIFYTSGTTGEPKGVVHTFKNLAQAAGIILDEFGINEREEFFSYLPLAHVAERLLVEILSLYSGSQITFAHSVETFAHDLQAAQPTVFLAVPRLWQKFQEGLLQKIPPGRLRFLMKVPGLRSLVKAKIRQGLGLGRARYVLTGAAPTPRSLLDWYRQFDIEILEVYGMTENLAFSHINRKGRSRVGTVGQVWPGVQHRLSPEGEVLVDSPATMVGYFKRPDLTQEVLEGRYLRTGDLGEIDRDGYLRITGRAKEMFKTSKGKYVLPSAIEELFAGHEFVEAVCVLGADMPQPVALVALSAAGKRGDPVDVSARLEELLANVNPRLNPHERLSHVMVTEDEWTIENGMLTPTLKLKRPVIEKTYDPPVRRALSSAEDNSGPSVLWLR